VQVIHDEAYLILAWFCKSNLVILIIYCAALVFCYT
jgi:hypothetical protein